MPNTKVERGRKVRLYDENDWFYEGRVTAIDWDEMTTDVDFGDWVQRYPSDSLRECWTDDGTYEQVLIPNHPGKVIADYREAA